MNIFVVNTNPRESARQLCDKHVVKMITESVQMLSNVMYHVGMEGPYKKTHWNHPCSIWVRESYQNYCWLYAHADELGYEYMRRYSNGDPLKKHKSHKVLHNYLPNEIKELPDIGLTPFVNCTPYKDIDNVVEAYKKFYMIDKSKFACWNKSSPAPEWFVKLG
jgi:hypothetical protein